MNLVSVLILNYRNPLATVACVRSFLEQSIAEQLEIIVIDNHSDDDSIGILRSRLGDVPNVRIVETPKNGGFGYGYNTGARYATGTYLLMNNPDKLFTDATGLQRMVAAMESDASVGILAPKLVHDNGTLRYSIRRFPRVWDVLSRRTWGRARRYLMLDTDREAMQEVDWVVGGCFCIRRGVFEEIGGFDERFFLFFEDADLCRRVQERGAKVLYMPSVEVRDKRSRLSGQGFWDMFFKKTGRIHVYSAIKYFWKWGLFP